LLKAKGVNFSLAEKTALFSGLEKRAHKGFGIEHDFKDELKPDVDSSVIVFSERIGLKWEDLSRESYQKINFLIERNVNYDIIPFFPISYQTNEINCGPACLKMICDSYGMFRPIEEFEDYCDMSETGTSMKKMMKACDTLGLVATYQEVDFEGFKGINQFPCIVRWLDQHFVVVYAIDESYVWVADPDYGLNKYTHTNFEGHWLYEGITPLEKGSVMTIAPTKPVVR